mgnify:CR=1 FL=1
MAMKAMLRHYKLILIIILLGGSALGGYIYHWEFRKPVLEVYFFHLDRGRSIFLRTPENRSILIDGGQNSQVLREITAVMPFYSRRIDTIILTNSAPKNAGGLVDVVKRYEIGEIIEPTVMGTSTALYAFEDSLKEKNLDKKTKKVGKGDIFTIDGVKFKILFPDPLFKFNKTSIPELVLEIEYGQSKILFLGDVSKTIQKSFLSEVGKVNIVEYAHTGSDSRTSKELLDKMNPDIVINSKTLAKTRHFVSDGRSFVEN